MIESLKKNIKDLINSIKGKESSDHTHSTSGEASDNKSVKTKQLKMLVIILSAAAVGMFAVVQVVQTGKKEQVVKAGNPKLQVEVAAEALDPEKMWHGYFEDKIEQSKKAFEDKLKAIEASFVAKEKELVETTSLENAKLIEQLKFSNAELQSAAAELKRVRELQQRPGANVSIIAENPSHISSINLEPAVHFDRPKSSSIYIPETSFVNGYLLGGLAVSTGINAPNENATPVVIRLSRRGNLPSNFKVDIATCRMLGSAYGDLSSERAIIRLEKLVCIDPATNLVTTTEVAGMIQGPDGMNGIKGKVVATNSKHLKNAMVGGLISGISSSAKGQEQMLITPAGGIGTQKKGFTDIAGSGLLGGASNAADKIANYYLRQAEAMSPVLTIPGGVKVDVVFTKGFYYGEQGVRKAIAKLRTNNQQEVRRNHNYIESTVNNDGYGTNEGQTLKSGKVYE